MKILIIRLSSIGDIVLTQPIVKRLHEVFPDAELHYLTKEQYKDIPEHFVVPLKVIPYSKTFAFHYMLSKQKYDYVFDLHAKFSTFLIKYATGIGMNFTYSKKHFLRKAIVKHTTEQRIDSTLDLYRTALTMAGKALNKDDLLAELSQPHLQIEQEFLDQMALRLPKPAGKKVIAVFPGATYKTKMYPVDCMIKVMQKVGAEYHFWLLGSKADTSLTYKINFETADKSTDLGGKFNLEETMAVIAMADAVVTNDSGPMHIAAALSKPQIAIFGATHPKLGFRPLNAKAQLVCKDLSCQPCSLHGGEQCPLLHYNCMNSIKPDEIISLIKTITR
jgi:heptosyltransferase-2